MPNRINYAAQSADSFKKYLDFGATLKTSSIDHALLILIDIRASQLNGCGFCLDMHIKQAKIAGEQELRLHHLAIWRESPLFTARERAALEWAELLTNLPPHGISDAAFAAVRAEFSEKEVSDLTFAAVAINGWNRVNIAFQGVPGSMDVAYGLTRAKFS